MIWLAPLLCLPAAFLLSGLAAALLCVSSVRARHAAGEGDRTAARLVRLLNRRNELFLTVTVLQQACVFTAFACLAVICTECLGPWGWAAALAVALPVVGLGIELVPKLLFRRYPFRLLRAFVGPLALLRLLSVPWAWLVRHATADAGSSDGMESLTGTLTTLGVLSPPVGSLVSQTAVFQRHRAADLMLPLAQLTALPPDMPLASVLALNGRPQHPWRAVLEPDGRLLGWLDMAALPSKPSPDKLVRQFMRPLLQLRHDESALRCLQALRRRGEPVAAVLDAKGDAVGVLPQEKLIATLLDAR